MPRIKISPRASSDLTRLFNFLAEKDKQIANNAIDTIKASFKYLVQMPFIGRPVEDELRELVIDFGSSGYLALYHYDTYIDVIIILAVRHQKEFDYK